MLGKLVNKFKKQSLQDGSDLSASNEAGVDNISESDGSPKKSPKLGDLAAAQEQRVLRKSARLASSNTSSASSPQLQHFKNEPLKANMGVESVVKSSANIFDSGTESDEDELEQFDSMSPNDKELNVVLSGAVFPFQQEEYRFDHGGSDFNIIGSSPPTLTSSPPLISEIDTSSWDSMGCESGIVLRESAERDDEASRNIDLLDSNSGDSGAVDATPVQRRDGFPLNFGDKRSTAMELGSDENSPCGTPLQTNNFLNSAYSAARMPIDFSALRDQNNILHESNESSATESSQKSSSASLSSIRKGGSVSGGGVIAGLSSKLRAGELEGHNRDDGGKGKGAFRPVVSQRSREAKEHSGTGFVSYSSTLAVHTSRTNTPSPNNLIGEKRRWGGVIGGAPIQHHHQTPPAPPVSPIASRTRGSMIVQQQQQLSSAHSDEVPERLRLTARRTRVRVLYHQDSCGGHPQSMNVKRATGNQLGSLQHEKGQGSFGESPPNSVNKRGRLGNSKSEGGSSERPCLNFDKMRERMMGFQHHPSSATGGEEMVEMSN